MRAFNSTFIPHPPFCICWNLIPKDKKLALEIGAGNGQFSLQFANKHKDWFLISLERTAEKSLSFHKKKADFPEAKENLFFIRADAVNVVTHLLKPETFDKIFLLYPNPYVKAKQSNLRWHNMPFFSELLTRLKTSGELELRTNLAWYATEFKERMSQDFSLALVSEEILDKSHTAQTAFEKKYLERGENCYRLMFRKEKL